MPTLILSPRYTEDSQLLWRTASQLGWAVERLPNWRVPRELAQVEEPVLYVEALMAAIVAEEFGLRLVEPPEDWLPRLPEEYRKRWVRASRLGQERHNSQPFFIKPPNDKSFTARVYRGDELPAEFPDEMPVLMSEVVEWEKEFRCFVLDRRVRSASIYLRGGELQRDDGYLAAPEELTEVHSFVGPLLADPRVEVPRAVVVDVGIIRGRGWAVVELNAAWGAGLYGCDPAEVLEVLRHACPGGNHDVASPH